MGNSSIITGQYVQIEQIPARTWERVAEFAIDFLLLSAYSLVIDQLYTSLKPLVGSYTFELFVVLYLPALLYWPLMETLCGGQTLGKRVLKTRVVKQDGSSPDVGSFLLRWLLLPVDIIFFGSVAAFSILITPNRQRLGDLAAGTMVIKLDTWDRLKVSLDEFQFVADDYQPAYPEARQLTTDDAGRIARTLADRSTSRQHRLREEARRVYALLGIADVGRQPEQFLARVLSDYRYYDLSQV